MLTLLFFITAILYAAVGLGGGSGYLAVMGLLGIAPEMMRPTALSLNILVAGIGTWTHVRAGQFSARLFWPIALVSIPSAFVGGRLNRLWLTWFPKHNVARLMAGCSMGQ
jgi:uncharacterized membrane protein YfcA